MLGKKEDWRVNDLTKKSFSRKYKLPKCTTIFNIERNPMQDNLAIPDMLDSVFYYSAMSAEEYWKMKDVTEFTAFFHPKPFDLDKYVNLARVMQYFFVMDDHEECEWGDGGRRAGDSGQLWDQFISCLDLVIDKKSVLPISPVHWKPYIAGFYFGIEEICRDYDQDQRIRLSNTYRLYALANQKEAKLIQQGHVLSSYDELFEVIDIFFIIFK